MRATLLVGLLALCATVAAPPASACPTGGQTRSSPPGSRWETHGNGRLWAVIPESGVVTAQPQSEQRMPQMKADGSVQDKVLFLGKRARAGKRRNLVIKGRRIDGDAEPFRIVRRGSSTARNLYWPGYITYTTTGCWKVVASFGRGTRLAFILSIQPPPDPPATRR